jgi:adenylate cyclase
MDEARTNRRLAAILAADVVGYSRMMAADEAGTLGALKRHRDIVFDPAVSRYGGRVVKLIGDGTLVEFASVVDAVNCALAVQRAGDSVITLRIGVNLGDVIIDGDDIYGDGVNVAARLEPLAEPGGICIASIVNESVGNRVDASFEDAGEARVKNIDRPIRVWKWSPGNGQRAGNKPAPAQAASPPDQPSIAVLPFVNMSGDAEQEYFSDGITEDIITDLSKVAGLLVIARNSSFAYKGRHVDIRKVASELRVRSVLEGSIRRAGNRVRITAQLIDAETGGHLWAERYDRDLTDIFELQDEVTREIVSALKLKFVSAKPVRTAPGTTNLEAQDLAFRGGAILAGPHANRESFERATALLRQAIERDPDFARPHALLAIAHVHDFTNHWSSNPQQSLAAAQDYAELAIAKDTTDAMSHSACALVLQVQHDYARGRAEAERAVELDPNLAMAITMLAMSDVHDGKAAEAIPRLERAMRLDPAYSHGYLHHLATAYLVTERFETAAVLFRERIVMAPGTDISRSFLASALGHLGEMEEAKKVWSELKAVNPGYSIDDHLARMPYPDLYNAIIRAGLVKAGLAD